jgi:hypothetical protein
MNLPALAAPNPVFKPWTADEEKLLGSMADESLAKKLGRTVKGVEARRIGRRIPKFAGRRHYWKPEDDKLLGVLPDEEVAKRLGATVVSVQVRRFKLGRLKPFSKHRQWTVEEDALLGAVPDKEAANRTGHPIGSVRDRRAVLGIKLPSGQVASRIQSSTAKSIDGQPDAIVNRCR